MENRGIVVIGAGPAGLAAAVKLRRLGAEDVLVIERENETGGILRQCIHDGFGLERFGKSISGPEYAALLKSEAEELGIECLTGTSVLEISKDRTITAASPSGVVEIHAEAIIAAAGCRERSRGSIMIPGERPAGVYTAGTAQAYMNLYNRMPGRNAVILGSGDIGLIMARRLTLEGAKVSAVFELQDHPNGLERNIVQCLDDYSIPLYLSHTVTEIHGKDRIEGVTVSAVDGNLRPIEGTEKYYPCDTLILSVGLIPDNTILEKAGVEIDPSTNGAVVDEHLMTSIPGIFSAGNMLHVHDLADFASAEAEAAAENAFLYASGKLDTGRNLSVVPGEGVSHTVPGRITGHGPFTASLRVRKKERGKTVEVRQGGKILGYRFFPLVIPSQMISVDAEAAAGCENVEVIVR